MSMTISAIAAVDNQMAIGKENKIPWYAPADLAFFKQKTLNQHILMGYKTYLSLPKLLPQREHIVLTRKNSRDLPQRANLNFVNTWEEVLHLCDEQQAQQLWVIGGEQIYAQLLPFCHYLQLSRIDTRVENPDAFFPPIPAHFELIETEFKAAEGKNLYNISFDTYKNTQII